MPVYSCLNAGLTAAWIDLIFGMHIIIMSLAPGTGAWPSWRTANHINVHVHIYTTVHININVKLVKQAMGQGD